MSPTQEETPTSQEASTQPSETSSNNTSMSKEEELKSIIDGLTKLTADLTEIQSQFKQFHALKPSKQDYSRVCRAVTPLMKKSGDLHCVADTHYESWGERK